MFKLISTFLSLLFPTSKALHLKHTVVEVQGQTELVPVEGFNP